MAIQPEGRDSNADTALTTLWPHSAGLPQLPADPELRSLLVLLSDPSPAVWEPVFRELRRRGSAAAGPLRAASRAPDARLRARARALLDGHDRRHRLRRLYAYAARSRTRLETAMWLFATLEGPRFDRRPFAAELDELAELVRGAHRGARGELDRAMALPGFLGERFAFAIPRSRSDGPLGEEGLQLASHHPHRIHLHRVLASRKGLPLSLALVWRMVADRLGLPMEILDLPGHVLVRIPAGPRRILVDPCTGGAPVSRREVREYLEAHDIPFGPRLLKPMNDRALLRRHTANLMRGLGLRGQVGQAEELLPLHELFDAPQR